MDPVPPDIQTPSLIPPDDPPASHPQLVQICFPPPQILEKAIMNFRAVYKEKRAPKKNTYLSANFQDHRAGVAQKSLALHSAWLVCVRLLSGGRNAFIFDFCLRAILF